MSRTHTLFALLLLVLTQSGCFTMLTATACLASSSKSCGGAVAAGVMTDVIIADAIAEGAADAESHAHGTCWDNAIAQGHDPELACSN